MRHPSFFDVGISKPGTGRLVYCISFTIHNFMNGTSWIRRDLGTIVGNLNLEGSKVGIEEERKKYAGNRISAQLGDSLIPLVVRCQALLVDGALRSMPE